jgi:hypothetical protein
MSLIITNANTLINQTSVFLTVQPKVKAKRAESQPPIATN